MILGQVLGCGRSNEVEDAVSEKFSLKIFWIRHPTTFLLVFLLSTGLGRGLVHLSSLWRHFWFNSGRVESEKGGTSAVRCW